MVIILIYFKRGTITIKVLNLFTFQSYNFVLETVNVANFRLKDDLILQVLSFSLFFYTENTLNYQVEFISESVSSKRFPG